MTTSDEDLALAAAGGDRAAFSSLVERHYDRVFRLAFRLMGTRAQAEDLTQDICLALPKKLSGFRGDARFSTWLYRVTVNAAHDARRKGKTYARAAEGWGEVELARRAEADAAQASARWLAEAMAALSGELQETLALVLDDGMTQREIGEVLGISEGTVAWRVSEIKRRLREVEQP